MAKINKNVKLTESNKRNYVLWKQKLMKYTESEQNQSITACYSVKNCYNSWNFVRPLNFSFNSVKVQKIHAKYS